MEGVDTIQSQLRPPKRVVRCAVSRAADDASFSLLTSPFAPSQATRKMARPKYGPRDGILECAADAGDDF